MIKQLYFLQFKFSITNLLAHSLNILNSFIWLIDKTLSDVNTPDHSEPGSNGNKGVLHIP